MKEFINWRQRGIPMGKINALMAVVTVVISVLLLAITYQTGVNYRALEQTTDQFIDWKSRAYDLQVGSDYLTEQVRCFVETGDRSFLDLYFEEAEVTRRRDRALDALRDITGKGEAFQALNEAMNQSVSLMDREYYAMRLTIEAFGLDIDQFPEAVRAVALSPGDAALPPTGKSELARSMVFDDIYHGQKQAISDGMTQCIDRLDRDMSTRRKQSAAALENILGRQRMLIFLLIALTLAIVLMTSLLVISPLLRAVLHIRGDQLIPVRGAYEFRFLAKTYNLMYEVNRESREQLAFEASHDKLTGLYNRSGYDFLIENSSLEECALLLVDVDNFKQVNDTYGHDIGDRTLARVGSVVQGCFRAQDHVCRIGGDEFAVIVQPMGPHLTDLLREKVRVINRRLSEAAGGVPATSVSVGIAFGIHATTPQTLFKAADSALYEVKGSGRHGCAIHEV